MSRTCNCCRQPIFGLDYNGRCEDCYADAIEHATGHHNGLCFAERVKYRLWSAIDKTKGGINRVRGRVVRSVK